MFERLSQFAQTGGMVIFVGIFAVVLIYALWPRNQAKFDHAARMPLEGDDDAPSDTDLPKDQNHV
tara:strand:- start:2332 stop:2526 length:195 start_codon:yes stop_codon:yes gene_type:complete